jgi:protoporphyrinogen oxidase
MKNVLIIGAGPAGLTAGYEITKDSQFKCTIIEKSNTIGGMARSFKLFNQIVDIGPHRFFSNDTRVNKLWLEVIGGDYKMVNRLTRIYYKNKYFDYPLKPFNALYNLGIYETFLCILSYLYYKIFPNKKIHTFEGWITNKFGFRLYNIFFKSYTEKLWGIPCENLTSEFAKQRIKKFSLGEAIISAMKLTKIKHKTLVDQFAYPLLGNGLVYDKMANLFIRNGGEILFEKLISEISYTNNKYIVKYDDQIHEFDHIISSMPITKFLNIFKNSTDKILQNCKNLKFRNTLIAYVNIENVLEFKDQWLYMQDKGIISGRITNFSNWVSEIKLENKSTVLALEYWCYDTDVIWNSEENYLKKIVINDLLNGKFIKFENQIIDTHFLKIPMCYPVYDNNYKPFLENIINFINSYKNLQLVGRYGSFKYNNQDHSILMGYLAARNITLKEENDLWNINTDYEYHESSTITSTGLVNKI